MRSVLKGRCSALSTSRNSNCSWFVLAMLMVLAVCAPSFASSEPMTVEEAVLLALRQNLNLRVDIQDLATTEAVLAGSRITTPFNPAVEISSGRRSDSAGTALDWGAAVSQEIEIGGQRGRRIAVAQVESQRILADVRSRGQALALAVRRAFAEAVLARERQTYARQLEALAQNLVDSAQLRFDEGASTKLELNLARAELGKASASRITAEGAAAVSLLELRRLLGMREEQTLSLAEDLALPETLPPNDATLEHSFSIRPDITALKEAIAQARAEERLARSLNTPNLEITAEIAQEGEEDVAAIGVGVSLPLFNRNQGEIGVAQSERRRAELGLGALEFQIEKDLIASGHRFSNAREALKIYQDEVLPSFEENLALLDEAFRGGKVDFLRVLAVQTNFVDQQQLYLDVLARAQMALLDWQLAAGRVLPSDWSPKAAAPTESKENEE